MEGLAVLECPVSAWIFPNLDALWEPLTPDHLVRFVGHDRPPASVQHPQAVLDGRRYIRLLLDGVQEVLIVGDG